MIMMGEKRFKTKYYLKSRQGVVLGVVKVNEEENVLHWNDVVDLLNEMNEDIQYLNAFLVEKNLAIEYIRWQKGSGDD